MNLKSIQYWQKASISYESMAGISEIIYEDIEINKNIIERNGIVSNQTLDLGCGIGRVTYENLYGISNKIDIVEQNKVFYNECLSRDSLKKIEYSYNKSIEDFFKRDIYNNRYYDLIWIQWVLEYISMRDIDFIFLNIKNILSKKGYILIKENISDIESEIYIEEQGSIIRNEKFYEDIINKYNFHIAESNLCSYSIKDIYPIKYWLINNII